MLVSLSSAQSTIPTSRHEQKDILDESCRRGLEIKMPGSMGEQILRPLTVKCECLSQRAKVSLHSLTSYHIIGTQHCSRSCERIKA